MQIFRVSKSATNGFPFITHNSVISPIWGRASNTNLQRLTRIVTDSPYDAHSEPLIKNLGWLTITQLIDTETVKIVYKALHNEAPKYLKELFHRLSDIPNRELRKSKTDL